MCCIPGTYKFLNPHYQSGQFQARSGYSARIWSGSNQASSIEQLSGDIMYGQLIVDRLGTQAPLEVKDSKSAKHSLGRLKEPRALRLFKPE